MLIIWYSSFKNFIPSFSLSENHKYTQSLFRLHHYFYFLECEFSHSADHLMAVDFLAWISFYLEWCSSTQSLSDGFMVPSVHSYRLYNLNQVLYWEIGLLAFKIPYLNTVWAQFLLSDQYLYFFTTARKWYSLVLVRQIYFSFSS